MARAFSLVGCKPVGGAACRQCMPRCNRVASPGVFPATNFGPLSLDHSQQRPAMVGFCADHRR